MHSTFSPPRDPCNAVNTVRVAYSAVKVVRNDNPDGF